MFLRLAIVVPLVLGAGEYVPRTVKSPAGRYYGTKGVARDPYGAQSLDLRIDAKGGATLEWTRRDEGGERERMMIPLKDVKVTEKGLTATAAAYRPKDVAERLHGLFVTKYPPGNAKGPVAEGILFEGDWFLEFRKPE